MWYRSTWNKFPPYAFIVQLPQPFLTKYVSWDNFKSKYASEIINMPSGVVSLSRILAKCIVLLQILCMQGIQLPLHFVHADHII